MLIIYSGTSAALTILGQGKEIQSYYTFQVCFLEIDFLVLSKMYFMSYLFYSLVCPVVSDSKLFTASNFAL